MRSTSTFILILAGLVLGAGIMLQINAFPGAFMPMVLGILGIILGLILRFVENRRPRE